MRHEEQFAAKFGGDRTNDDKTTSDEKGQSCKS